MSTPNPPADPSVSLAAADVRGASWRMAAHWPELVVAITEQSVSASAHLLRGLDLMLQRGRLTPAEHKVLAMPVCFRRSSPNRCCRSAVTNWP